MHIGRFATLVLYSFYAAVFVYACYEFFTRASGGVIALVIVVLWLGGVVVGAHYEEKKNLEENSKKAEKQRQYLSEKSSQYKKALARKRTQLIVKDDYGDVDDSKWKAEIVAFFNSKIASIPKELAMSNEQKVLSASEIAEIIDLVAIEGQKEFDDLYSFSEDMGGVDYELFCADLLRQAGWDAQVSNASNDQGADIIAERGKVKIVVQCKRYSSPVGNKAVQEVIASQLHYRANYAAVVTNSSFTRSAKQLASSAKVMLLHHSDLANMLEE